MQSIYIYTLTHKPCVCNSLMEDWSVNITFERSDQCSTLVFIIKVLLVALHSYWLIVLGPPRSARRPNQNNAMFEADRTSCGCINTLLTRLPPPTLRPLERGGRDLCHPSLTPGVQAKEVRGTGSGL